MHTRQSTKHSMFLDLCQVAAFETAYKYELWQLRDDGHASKRCRALSRVFRSARRFQPKTLNGICAFEDYDAKADATVLLSPVADTNCQFPSFAENGKHYVDNTTLNNDPVGEALLHPDVTATLLKSVALRKIQRVPRNTLVIASENELFKDDALYLQQLGAQTHLFPFVPGGTFHAWPLWDIPESTQALELIRALSLDVILV